MPGGDITLSRARSLSGNQDAKDRAGGPELAEPSPVRGVVEEEEEEEEEKERRLCKLKR